MSKITQLPYEAPYCRVCGRELPRGRTRKCYACLPPRGHHTQAPPRPDLPYSLDDRVAQAEAYGITYGKLMAAVENNYPLPPMKRPIRWPEGSEHQGE